MMWPILVFNHGLKDHRILVKKNHWQHLTKSRTDELGMSLLKSTVKRCFMNINTEVSQQRVKLCFFAVEHKGQTWQEKTLKKKPDQFWNKILWTDKIKINSCYNYEKRTVWRKKEKTSSVKYGGGSVFSGQCIVYNARYYLSVVHLAYIWNHSPFTHALLPL